MGTCHPRLNVLQAILTLAMGSEVRIESLTHEFLVLPIAGTSFAGLRSILIGFGARPLGFFQRIEPCSRWRNWRRDCRLRGLAAGCSLLTADC